MAAANVTENVGGRRPGGQANGSCQASCAAEIGVIRRNRAKRIACAVCFAFCVLLVLLYALHGTLQTAYGQDDPIGYDRLVDAVGPSLESGMGVVVSQVEANVGDASNGEFRYLPDETNSQFDGKTIIDGSGLSTGSSGHATSVGRTFYGNTASIAPDVSTITGYEAGDWLGRVLGFNTGSDPLVQEFQVSNHSYIGNGLTEMDVVDLLQRVDYAINENQMTTVVGMNNGDSTSLPQLLGQGYNSISVGRTDGNHSHGFTTLYGSGRIKPDLVAPRSTTSIATPLVSSVSAVLHEKAVNLGNPDAVRPEVMKSIIMAGATKEEFPSWDRTSSRPLDDQFGAGELNIFNSYFIMDGGEFEGASGQPSSSVAELGWDYGESLAGGDSLYYDLDAQKLESLADLSVMLNWNMQITDTDSSDSFNAQTELADLSLRLYDSTNGFLDELLDSSLSDVDNVEHLFFESLESGLYTIEVTNESDFAASFGLAWRAQAIPEPLGGAAILFALSGIFAFSRRRRSDA